MRTLTTPAPAAARRPLTRISAKGVSALGVACAAALALTACGGSGSVHKGSPTGTAGSFPGAQTSSTPTPQPSFDPLAGPTMTPAQLPKTCSGLVTDADMQLALGNPLNGGDYFTAFQPTAAKQLGRVRCQYGVVQDASGKVTGDQVEIQLAIYADAATAQSHGASTVGDFAGKGDQYAPISVAGHPATYVTEAGKDAVLVMYDGNRTYLITTEEALVKGDDAKAFTLKIAQALYKHTTPNAPASPSSGGSSSGSGAPSGGASSSGAAPSSGAPSSPSGSAPAGGSSAPGQPSSAGKSQPPSSPPAD